MARLGRRQPFAPITKRRIQYQPAAPVADAPYIVSFAANDVRKPRLYRAVTNYRELFTPPTKPVAAKPEIAGFAALESRRPRSFPPIINRVIQFLPFVPRVADAPCIVSFGALESRRPRLLHPVINRVVRYLPLVNPVGKSYVISHVAYEYRKPRSFGTIIKQRTHVAPITAPVSKSRFVLWEAAVESSRRAHTLRAAWIGTPPAGDIKPASLIRLNIKIGHDETVTESQGRRHGQDVATLLNALSRSGAIQGTLKKPYLAYFPADRQQWSPDVPASIWEALDRLVAAQGGNQPLDSDLTAIALLTTTLFGRTLLTLADAAAGRTAFALGTLATQSGTFSGTSSGTNTGDQTTVSGNAGTATALQTARTINGVSFDGTANISIPGGAYIASFFANKNGTNQTGILSATVTKVTYTTETSDVGSYYDATNSKWTPPAGAVLIGAVVNAIAGVVDQNRGQLRIYKNGTPLTIKTTSPSGAQFCPIDIMANDIANGTDYYEIYFYLEGPGNKTIEGAVEQAYFFGYKI